MSDNRLQPIFEPSAIEARSFEIIDAEVPEPRPFSGARWEIVRRMIHTTADFEMPGLVRFSDAAPGVQDGPDPVQAGLAALASSCEIFTDTEMARCGIPLRRMQPLGCTVTCLMNDPAVVRRAQEESITRATAAVDALVHRLGGSIVVVGNAPTALIRLMERFEDPAAPRPALVVAMPVGFVNAAESKALFMERANLPYIALAGRKGGSALAATVVNALAEIVLRDKA